MKLSLDKVEGSTWEQYCAAHAHQAVFGERLPPEYDRIDFALMALDVETSKAVGYITVREFDAESAYLKHGGAFPPIKGTIFSYSAFRLCLSWLVERYKRITTLVENTNRTYLKMALSAGFRVIGIRNFQGLILLELFMEGT